jgi:1,2-beta-oligoglucan phosphorylase
VRCRESGAHLFSYGVIEVVGEALTQHLSTPREDDLGLLSLGNPSGLRISRLPNGAIFTIEAVHANRRILINQTLGSAIAGSMGRLCVRIGGARPMILCAAGGGARAEIAAAADGFVWRGETGGVAHTVSLRLDARLALWLWHCEVRNRCDAPLPCDAVLIQDLGLGSPGFLMNNEAYASQYLDHHVAQHSRMGPVLMGRQNLSQGGSHPWVAHGCLEGAVGFATDYRQIMGPVHRDGDEFGIPFGTDLPSIRLQHESACAALQSRAVSLRPGASTSWTFFGFYRPDHPDASSDDDLALIQDAAQAGTRAQPPLSVRFTSAPRSLVQEAPAAVADPLDATTLQQRYPQRSHVERLEGRVLSFFTPAETHRRHVVLREKERHVLRRHGALLLGGAAQPLPGDETLSLTCWMHGIFGAQLALGNTSFHRLFSISRDPYNITRGSGMRMLVDAGEGWRLLTVPSAFEMGLEDCRWNRHRLSRRGDR